MFLASQGQIHPNVFLADNYDLNEVPSGPEGQPIVVNFSMNLANILAIDEPNQVIGKKQVTRM